VARHRNLTTLGPRTAIWTLPIATLVHDAEELLFVPTSFFQVSEEALELMPRVMHSFIPRSRAQFAGWTALDLGLTSLASVLAAREDEPGPATRFFTVMVVFEALDVLDHAARWIVEPRYAPGLVTSPLVSLPHSIWSLNRLLRDRRIDGRFLSRALAATLPVSLLVLAAALLSRVLRFVGRNEPPAFRT
jgi:hypothetical protein